MNSGQKKMNSSSLLYLILGLPLLWAYDSVKDPHGRTDTAACSCEEEETPNEYTFDDYMELSIVHHIEACFPTSTVSFELDHDEFYIVYLYAPPSYLTLEGSSGYHNDSKAQYKMGLGGKEVSIESITVSSPLCSSSVTPYSMSILKGTVLSLDSSERGQIKKGRIRRYATIAHPSDLSMLISLQPDQSSANMDLDLYVYHESDIFDFFFPSKHLTERNHHWNTPEYAYVNQNTFPSGGMFLIYVYAPTETKYELNDYVISTERNYDAFYLYVSLIGSIGGLCLSVCCLFLAVISVIRHQQRDMRLFHLRSPGATQKELELIPLTYYGDSTIEDTVCSICLDEFSTGQLLRTISCGHAFHKVCVDSWLLINKSCPLCKQECTTARNVRRSMSP